MSEPEDIVMWWDLVVVGGIVEVDVYSNVKIFGDFLLINSDLFDVGVKVIVPIYFSLFVEDYLLRQRNVLPEKVDWLLVESLKGNCVGLVIILELIRRVSYQLERKKVLKLTMFELIVLCWSVHLLFVIFLWGSHRCRDRG